MCALGDQNTKLVSYVPISGLIGIVLTLELSVFVYASYSQMLVSVDYVDWAKVINSTQNIVLLAKSYTQFTFIILYLRPTSY